MAEVKKEVKPVDPWSTPKETWQYVTIPEEDPTGLVFPPIGLNKMKFEAGQTYHLPQAYAQYVNDRVKVFNRSVVRLFQPNVDRLAQQQVSVGSASPMAPSGDRPTYVDATTIKTL